ncbi:M23 family metallopeptidase [Bacillus fonticola]|uniref:M23 family metallopeptidase n=1 Tax=Bacillus fonticola TaxID=2728853 RepID=UPI001472B90D|nr:M23 family metallopeptidase [Bacillus fonticola]
MREEEKQTSPKPARKFFRKRWVFPAMYIAVAAIIISTAVWFQATNQPEPEVAEEENTNVDGSYGENETNDGDAVEVTADNETFAWPVVNQDEAVIETQYYDAEGSDEEREAALVFYNNTYQQSKGVDIASQSGESFDVTASMSGTILSVTEDALLGNIVEIEHGEGIITHYSSLEEVQVAVGDQVEQGDVLAQAGQSLFNEEAGIHVHFEIRKDGDALNPLDYFNQPLSSLYDATEEDDSEGDSNAEEPAGDEESVDSETGEEPADDEDEAEGVEDDQEDGQEEESPDASIGQSNT